MFHRFGHVAAGTYLWATTAVGDTLFVLIAGSRLAAHYFFLAGPPIIVMLIGPERRFFPALYVAVYVALFLAIESWAPQQTDLVPLPDWFATMSFAFCVTSGAIINLVAALYATQRAESAEKGLELEHQRSERLLNALVPAPIAKRLKDRPGGLIADDLPEVTILFADLVNFTPFVSSCPSNEVVSLLNSIFSEFDGLAERHGLEKIKTVGDAYMVAGGVPVQRPGHAISIAEMALDMRAALRQLSADLGREVLVRIGIDSGPTVAGVIGSQKPFYDVWGDTVNTAARMETHGIPGQIQVTRRAMEAIGPNYAFEERGPIEVKGKGMMPVYLLRDRMPAGAPTD